MDPGRPPRQPGNPRLLPQVRGRLWSVISLLAACRAKQPAIVGLAKCSCKQCNVWFEWVCCPATTLYASHLAPPVTHHLQLFWPRPVGHQHPHRRSVQQQRLHNSQRQRACLFRVAATAAAASCPAASPGRGRGAGAFVLRQAPHSAVLFSYPHCLPSRAAKWCVLSVFS